MAPTGIPWAMQYKRAPHTCQAYSRSYVIRGDCGQFDGLLRGSSLRSRGAVIGGCGAGYLTAGAAAAHVDDDGFAGARASLSHTISARMRRPAHTAELGPVVYRWDKAGKDSIHCSWRWWCPADCAHCSTASPTSGRADRR